MESAFVEYSSGCASNAVRKLSSSVSVLLVPFGRVVPRGTFLSVEREVLLCPCVGPPGVGFPDDEPGPSASRAASSPFRVVRPLGAVSVAVLGQRTQIHSIAQLSRERGGEGGKKAVLPSSTFCSLERILDPSGHFGGRAPCPPDRSPPGSRPSSSPFR